MNLNKAQRFLCQKIKKLWFENRIIRLFILKARQLGCSTFIEALIYSITSQLENHNAVVIADDLDGSNYIFEMSKLYQEKIPDHLKVPTKKSNEKKVEFKDTHSQIIIDTAENKEAGRGYTYRVAHLSEYAYFRHAETLMVGLSQSVPSLPRTMVIKETTANGFNFAKQEWDAIQQGESDQIGIFIPWFWGEDYLMPAGPEFVVGDPRLGLMTKDELIIRNYMVNEGLDQIEDRLAWRRWCIRNSCGNGSLKERIASFKQEYPSTPVEAFKASGECYFDSDVLIETLNSNPQPKFKANIVKRDGEYIARKSESGMFKFFAEIFEDVQYCIGGDASSGVGADWSFLTARRKDTNEIVATFRGKVDPDELAEYAARLGHYLNDAVIAIENDKFGFAANKKLLTIYGNVYCQVLINRKTKKKTQNFGWNTTSITRPAMLAQLQEEIREESLEIPDPIIINECLTFIENADTGKVEAQEGCNDDSVIATAISGMVRQIQPYKKPKPKAKFREIDYKPNAGFGFN